MADEQNGKFQEVIELSLNIDKFIRSLQRSLSEIKKFIRDVRDTNDVLVSNFDSLFEKLETGNSASIRRRVKVVKEGAEEEISIETKKQQRLQEIRNRLSPSGAPGPDANSAVFRSNNPNVATRQDIAFGNEAAIRQQIADNIKKFNAEQDQIERDRQRNYRQIAQARKTAELADQREAFRQATEAEKLRDKLERDALSRRLAYLRQINKERIAEEKKAAAELAKIAKANEPFLAPGFTPSGGRPSLPRQFNQFNAPGFTRSGGTPSVPRTQDEPAINQSFTDRIFKGFANSAAVALRYSIIFGAIQNAVDALSAAVLAPFRALVDGIKYLQQLETQAIELQSVLNANVEFSKDFKENLIASAQAAKQVQRALEDVAAETGVNLERLQSVFKFFINNNGIQLVGNLKDAIQFAKLYTVIIEGAGLQSLQLASETAKIGELLSSNKFNKPIFLEKVALTAAQWIKIRDAAQKTGNILPELEKRAQPYLDSIKSVALQQTRVIQQVELLINRIKGDGAKTIYTEISEALIVIRQWLQQNGDQLVDVVTVAGGSIASLANALANLGVPSLLLKTLQAVSLVIGESALGLEYLAGQFRYIVELATVVAATIGDPGARKKLVSEVDVEQQERLKKQEARAKALVRLQNDLFGIANPTVGNSETDRLSQGVSSKSGSNRDPSQAGVANAELNEELKGLEEKRSRIKNALDAYRNLIKEDVAEKNINRQQAAVELVQFNQNEIAVERELLAEGLKIIEEKRKQARQGTTDVEQLRTLEANFDNKAIDLKKKFYDNQRQLNAASSQAEREAARERVQNTRAEIDEERKVRLAGIDRKIQESKAAKEAGFTTQVEAFDEQTALEREKLVIQAEVAKSSLEQEKAYTDNRIRALRDYEVAVKNLAEFDKTIITKRKVAQDQEIADFAKAAGERLKIENDLLESQVRLSEQINGRPNFLASDELLKKRREELDLAIRQKEAELNIQQIRRQTGQEDTVAIQNLTNDLNALNQAKLENLAQRIGGTNSLPQGGAIQNILRNRVLQEARRDAENITSSGLVGANKASPQQIEFAKKLVSEIDKLILKNNPTLKNVGKNAFSQLTGISFEDFNLSLGKSSSGLKKAAVTAELVAAGLAAVGNAIGVFQSGSAQGGKLGGIGALATQFGDLAGPVFGPFVKAFGGVASLIGNIFVRATKRIVEDVNRQFEATLQDFNRGNLGLADTIDSLNRQRDSAIQRLSGKKNGKEELDKILKQFDDELFNLQKQRKEIIDSFDEELVVLRVNSDYLSQISKQWTDINKQVKDYITAGGDAGKAAEFLSLQLGNIKQAAIDSLAQAEQDAIADITKLNDLLKERNRIVDDFKDKEFDLINQDSVERRQTGSVARGKELVQLRKEFQDNLDNIDQEIKLQTTRVNKEREVFNLTNDTADLRRRDEELTSLALDKQITKLKEMQSIVASITGGAGGLIGSGIFGNSTTNINVTVNGSPGDTAEDFGSRIADSLSIELSRRQRLAPA